uniref:protein-tyrosine-phosphatase n=1 Tax=Oncorhynchus kisutch TaxID=8019 RepID=A0A8C7DMQ2_ONCKI
MKPATIAAKQFLEEITKWTTQHGVSQLSWEVAVKFLMARKFDVLLAIELFHSYRVITCLKEGIVKLQPQEEPLHSELLSGKFTVLSVRDPSGASIALYTAKLHRPNKTGNHVVLQALFYLLDRAVESNDGLSFLFAYLNCSCHNMDSVFYQIVTPILSVAVTKACLFPQRSDYINASFMDGYKQKNAYIGTQGPLEKTYGDFWRMVWEQNVLVIVMTTRTNEGGRKKCGQYWPLEEGGQEVYSHMAVVNQRVDNHSHYSQTTLELYNMEVQQPQVTHFQYLSWPDYGVPTSRQQRQAVKGMGPRWRGHPLGPPMVVHCSAGIGRTGTFCALDICLSQLQDMGTLNVCQTVRWMRTQRAFTIQTPDQYYFCHNAWSILEHAQRQGLLSASQ